MKQPVGLAFGLEDREKLGRRHDGYGIGREAADVTSHEIVRASYVGAVHPHMLFEVRPSERQPLDDGILVERCNGDELQQIEQSGRGRRGPRCFEARSTIVVTGWAATTPVNPSVSRSERMAAESSNHGSRLPDTSWMTLVSRKSFTWRGFARCARGTARR